ncbi:hypothetical protein AL524_24885 [Citrobacter amalonaticus]|nr:hypothetical protein AL524_24885 [Citrobacter amalonaticus]
MIDPLHLISSRFLSFFSVSQADYHAEFWYSVQSRQRATRSHGTHLFMNDGKQQPTFLFHD